MSAQESAQSAEAEYVDCACGHDRDGHDANGCFPACGCTRPGPAPTPLAETAQLGDVLDRLLRDHEQYAARDESSIFGDAAGEIFVLRTQIAAVRELLEQWDAAAEVPAFDQGDWIARWHYRHRAVELRAALAEGR